MSKRGTEKSFKRVAKQVDAFGKQMRKGFGVGLRVIGEEVMTDVRASRPGKGVPKDTGTLASTGRVETKTRSGVLSVILSFGGAAARYALVQHERLDYKHVLGEARYLVRGVERYTFGGSAGLSALQEQFQIAALRAQAAR